VSRPLPTPADLVVFALAAVLLAGLHVLAWRQAGAGPVVTARVETPFGTRYLPLDRPGTYRVRGALGESVLEVRGGAVRFVDSPCRAKVCVRAGWVREAGALAACLPNGVVVTLTGPGGAYDAINF